MTTIADEPAPNRVHLSCSGTAGAHWAWFDGQGSLVVEWYDHGPHALYESANILRFAPADAATLLGQEAASTAEALAALQRLYASWWEVRRAAAERKIPFSEETDFLP